MDRGHVRPVFAVLVLAAVVSAVATLIGADAGLAVAQPLAAKDSVPIRSSGGVSAATWPGATPRLVVPVRDVRPGPVPPVAHPRSTHESPRATGRRLAAARGWTGRQWVCLDELWTRESNWHVHDRNGSSGAYGIPQALPGHKMAGAGSDWRDSAVTQIRWGLSYISSTYGTPCGAWQHSENYGYY